MESVFLDKDSKLKDEITIKLRKKADLKYGPNPQSNIAAAYEQIGFESPLKTINGNPGHINRIEALDMGWAAQKLGEMFKSPSIVVSKHDTPTGLAVCEDHYIVESSNYEPLSKTLEKVFEVEDQKLSPQAVAFVRSLNTDNKAAFGGIVASSHYIDYSTAEQMKPLVLDGVVAPGYDEDAKELLLTKRIDKDSGKSNFVMMEYDKYAKIPSFEVKERRGEYFVYNRSDFLLTPQILEDIIENPDPENDKFIPTKNKKLTSEDKRDLIIANISALVSQSNSVSMAKDGQTTGVGGGGQARVDATENAGEKTNLLYLRQHPKVLDLEFREDIKPQDKINTKIAYIRGWLSNGIQDYLMKNLTSEPKELSQEEKKEFLDEKRKGIALGSDAFYPFQDGISLAHLLYGVDKFSHTGISRNKDLVTNRADEFNMVEIRLGKNARGFKH